MASYQIVEGVAESARRTEQLVFAGDDVRLSGQIDYPAPSDLAKTCPLVFILPHACNTREYYQPHADLVLASGCAVFRWDKRGTGRSGACALGSPTQDAVNAYEVALDQARVNRKQVVILAQGSGTGLLGNAFGLFARIERPAGVILMTNLLDERAILAIESPLQIIMAQEDWNPWQKYGKAAAAAHATLYDYGATYYVAPRADRMLMDARYDPPALHAATCEVIQDWLRDLLQTSGSI